MILVNGFWICSLTYYSTLYVAYQKDAKQANWQNIVATVGNIFFAIHDWIFTQEYLTASLMMPLAMKMVDPHSSEDIGYYIRKKANAVIISRISTAAFYTMIVAYFFISTIYGDLVWRTSINVIFFYIAAIFCFSLLRIKRLIRDI